MDIGFKELVKLLNRVLDLFAEIYKAYKQRERQKNIEKIKKNPNKAWEERFGGK